MTDRRAGLRFEIIGRLRGTLAAQPAVRVHNISRSGALIEASCQLPPQTLCRVRLDAYHHVTVLEARVCHVRQGYTEQRYLIGLEFLAVEAPAAEHLDAIVARQVSPDVQSSW